MIHRINSVAPDVDDRVIKPNQARSVKNLRFGSSDDDSNLSGGILVNGIEEKTVANQAINPYAAEGFSGADSKPKALGYFIDYEGGKIYVAIYRESPVAGQYDNRHQIVQIDIKTDAATPVVVGQWLNFQKDSSVSIAYIDGKIYWTDNINEPRMVNVNKAIATYTNTTSNPLDMGQKFYPLIIPGEQFPALWAYSQIKRTPQGVMEIVYNNTTFPPNGTFNYYWITLDSSIPKYLNRNWIVDTPYQFSYYYVYDNNEESRLAPWTKAVYQTSNLTISIPSSEFYYLNLYTNTIVKEVVFVMRQGYEGLIYNIYKFKLSDVAWPPTSGNIDWFPIKYKINRIDGVDKTPTPADVYLQRYDSVPLLSRNNTIANNILNHANVKLDYETYGTIKFTAAASQDKTQKQKITVGYTPESQFDLDVYKTFRPGSTYTIGMQLIDEYGRCSPVINTQSVSIPNPKYGCSLLAIVQDRITGVKYYRPNSSDVITDDIGGKVNTWPNVYNVYNIDITVSGSLPSYAKYVRFCMTKNQSVQFFHKTFARLYYWYQHNQEESIFIESYLAIKNYINFNSQGDILKNTQRINTDAKYVFRGYGLELCDNVPFIYNSAEEQYVRIARTIQAAQDINVTATSLNETVEFLEYKIAGVEGGSVLLLEEGFSDIKFYAGYQFGTINKIQPCYHIIEIYTKKKEQEVVFYEVPAKNITDNTYKIYGDCYLSYVQKDILPQSIPRYTLKNYDTTKQIWICEENQAYSDSGYTYTGYFYSMNPTNIYNEKWNSDLGLENIADTGTTVPTKYPYSIVFSDSYNVGSKINNLNRFNPLNIRQTPAENGELTSLVLTNAQQDQPGVLLAIGTLGVSSFYYNAVQLTNVDGTTNLATTDQHLASQRPLIGQFGTSNQLSISKTTFGNVYWWSDVVNDFIRYSRAGLERLGLTYMFANKARIDAQDKKVITGYDFLMDEAVMIPDGGNAFVFSERFKTFQGYREYFDGLQATPEMMIGTPTKTYFFLNGLLHASSVDAEENKFFGVKYNPVIEIITNEYPTVIKQWNSVRVFGPKPVYTQLKVGTAEGFYHQTEIKNSWWIKRKGEYDAAVRRSTVGGGDGMDGKVMESRILYSTFVFDANDFDKLNFIEIKSNTAVTQ